MVVWAHPLFPNLPRSSVVEYRLFQDAVFRHSARGSKLPDLRWKSGVDAVSETKVRAVSIAVLTDS
jgi:hypothetical protein